MIHIFAGLSASGSVAGRESAVAKIIIDDENAQRKLEEDRRHNMKEMGKTGSGLYLRRTQRGGYERFLKEDSIISH